MKEYNPYPFINPYEIDTTEYNQYKEYQDKFYHDKDFHIKRLEDLKKKENKRFILLVSEAVLSGFLVVSAIPMITEAIKLYDYYNFEFTKEALYYLLGSIGCGISSGLLYFFEVRKNKTKLKQINVDIEASNSMIKRLELKEKITNKIDNNK